MQATVSPNLTTYGNANVKFDVEGREQGQGYLATNGHESKLGLVLLSEWWGLNVNICGTAERFGELGFKTIVLDVYRGKAATNMENAGHLKDGLDFEGAVRDIDGAARYLIEKEGVTKVGTLGYCMGGALSLATASRKTRISAAVAYYGTPKVDVFKPSDLTVPVLGNFALNDHAVGFSDVETIQAYQKLALEAQKDFTLILYNAEHSFNNKDTPRYNQDCAERALERSVEFLTKHLQ